MALVLADRVLETCTSPGTGVVSLLGAVTGYQAFSATVGNGNTCYYTIADQNGANWEVGIGTYSSSGNTLARTTVLTSSNGGSLTNFASGSQNVFLTYPAEKAVSTDTLAYPPAIGGTTPNTGAFTTLTLTNALTTANGGTGLSSYTAGDLPYYTTGTALSKLGIGTNGQVLTSNGSAPQWTNASSIVGGAAGSNTQVQFNNSGALGASSAFTWDGTTLSATKFAGALNGTVGATTPSTGAFTSLTSTLDTIATDGLWAKGTLNTAFTNGVAVDYTSGTGRISTGASTNLTFYTGGLATTQVLQVKYQGQINFAPLASNPASASAGDLYYNSTTNKFQAYNGTSWSAVGGGVTISDTAPSTPTSGDLWWESDTGTMYVYYTDVDSSQWVQAAGGGGSGSSVYPTGGGSDQIFYENGQTVTASYTLNSGKNAMTAGPITINAGATVTVPSGQNWVIL